MKFKLDALVHLHLCGNSDKKKKKELSLCSKDLDNPTYGLFKKPGRYSRSYPYTPMTDVGRPITGDPLLYRFECT
jgi:hypothetical protein